MKLMGLEEGEYEISAIEAWKPPTPEQTRAHFISAVSILKSLEKVIDPHVPLALNEPSNVTMGRIFATIGVMMNDARMVSESKGVNFGPVEMLALGIFMAPILTEAFAYESEVTNKQLKELEKLRSSAN